MAAYLLSGDHWTARRLVQASELLGDAFDAAFHAPPSSFQRSLETHDINTRALQLEKRIAEMDRRLALDLEPQQGDEENLGGRGFGARRTPQSNPRNE